MALLEATANGLPLNDGQAAFVRELATSGARCQLALAPAGTGKTTALQVLTRAWVEDGGHIVAVAPSAAAARLLGQATGTPADTLAKLLDHLADPTGRARRIAAGRVDRPDAGAGRRGRDGRAPPTSPASSSMRRRRAPVCGWSVMTGSWPRSAPAGCCAIWPSPPRPPPSTSRSGSPIRPRPTPRSASATATTTRSSTTSTGAGSRSATNTPHRCPRSKRGPPTSPPGVTRCCSRAPASRSPRSTPAPAPTASPPPPHAGGSRGGRCGWPTAPPPAAGDPIITRHNDRRLPITATDWVKNGDRWTVHAVHRDGSLTAVHRDTARHVRLPADYVAEHVALGYATTIHGAQGATADICHTVITGTETREQLYVALSRGRDANHLHVVLPGAADEHAPIRRDTLLPPAAVDLLHRVLDREAAQRSATTERRALDNPARRLREAVARYTDSLTLAPTTSSDDARPVAAAPLPWLPPVPACADPAWTSYLTARAGRSPHSPTRSPRDIANRSPGSRREPDPCLRGDLALWTITHPAEHDGREPTARERLYLRHLAQRRNDPTAQRTPDPRRRWLALVGAVHPPAVNDPAWPALAERADRRSPRRPGR